MKNKSLKLLVLSITILLCMIIDAKAASCPSGWVQNSGRSDCCPKGFSYSSSVSACLGKYSSSCSSYGGGMYTSGLDTYCKVKTRSKIESYTMTFYANGTTRNPASFSGASTYSKTCSGYNCQIASAPSVGRTHYSLVGWSEYISGSALIAFPKKMTKNINAYAIWKQNPSCYKCGGTWLYGTFAESPGCDNNSLALSKEACEAQNPKNDKPDDGGGSGGAPTGGYIPSSEAEPTPGTTETATVVTYYKITYNLDGGHFIDGSTTRIEIAHNDRQIGDFKTNPVKYGYAFVGWQYNGTAVDSSKKLSEIANDAAVGSSGLKEVEFKATYEEYGDADLVYCEDKNAALDLSNKKCYTVLKENSSNNVFTHTTYSYPTNSRWCYAYNASESRNGGLHFVDNVTVSEEGKKNETGGVYAGYSSDPWVSENTCLIASACQHDRSWRDSSACTVKWNTILYKSVSAKEKEREYEQENIEGQGGGDDSEPADLTDEEAKKIQTGDVLIIVVCILGVSAIGYTAYYFIKKKNPDAFKNIFKKNKKK